MRAILAFELRLLRGGMPVVLFCLLVTGALALALVIGRVTSLAAEAAAWIAPILLLILLWRERTAQRQLDALAGSIPLSLLDLLIGHLLFWAGAAVLPAIALGLLAYGHPATGPAGPFILLVWMWFIAGICLLGAFTSKSGSSREDPHRGLLVFVTVFLLTSMVPNLFGDTHPVATLLFAVLIVALLVGMLRSRSVMEFLPTLTPKRVRVGETSKPTRGRAVPWRRRRDREGVLQARARNARSPRATLVHLLAPFWIVPFFGLYLSGVIGMAAKRAGTTAGVGLVVLLVILHVHLYLALPRWQFFRQAPIEGRRMLLWLLAPLLLALIPSAFIMRGAMEPLGPEDFAPRMHTGWSGAQTGPVLRVPRAMQGPLENATEMPWQLPPSAHGLQFQRDLGQALIEDEAGYFERVVTFFLRTRFHVAPVPGELRTHLGEPQSPERIAALAMWGGKRDANGNVFVDGEFPLDLHRELVSEQYDLMQRARGDHLPGATTPPDVTARLEYEARVAQILATHKRDGAVYEFGESLLRVWAAFEGRIQRAHTRRRVLDLVAFLVVLLASLRWGLRDPASRWLAPLLGAALILGWSQLAWWPVGTTVYVWSLQHFGSVLSGGLVLVALFLVAFVRALRTMEAPAVESL